MKFLNFSWNLKAEIDFTICNPNFNLLLRVMARQQKNPEDPGNWGQRSSKKGENHLISKPNCKKQQNSICKYQSTVIDHNTERSPSQLALQYHQKIH